MAAKLTPISIPIHERVELPESWIPADSRVEIDAKITAGQFVSSNPHTDRQPVNDRAECCGIAGYFTTGHRMTEEELAAVKGRSWEEQVHPIRTIAATETDPNTALIIDHAPGRDIRDSGRSLSARFERVPACMTTQHAVFGLVNMKGNLLCDKKPNWLMNDNFQDRKKKLTSTFMYLRHLSS